MGDNEAALRLWRGKAGAEEPPSSLCPSCMSLSEQYTLLQSVLAREGYSSAFEGVSHFLSRIIRNASPLFFEINHCRKP